MALDGCGVSGIDESRTAPYNKVKLAQTFPVVCVPAAVVLNAGWGRRNDESSSQPSD
jgi:hypothetical protein